MDRRAMFFWLSAVVSAVLLWPCEQKLRWVGGVLVVSYVVLGALCQLETSTRSRRT